MAQAKDGTLWAIQAKAYAPENTVTKKDMDSFLAESGRSEFAHRLLIATTRHFSSNADRACKHAVPPVSKVLRHKLDNREGLPWPVSYAAWAKGRIPKAKPKRPYPHVRRAIRATLQKLKTHDRGQVLMACDTGKTLTALWVHERLPSSRTLVLVPSLSLLGQTLQEWVGNAKTPFETLPVCSDDTVRRERSRKARRPRGGDRPTRRLRTRFPTRRVWRWVGVITVVCYLTVLAPQQTFAQDARITFNFLRPSDSEPQAPRFSFEMLDTVSRGDLTLPAFKLVSTDAGTKVTNYTMALPVLRHSGLVLVRP